MRYTLWASVLGFVGVALGAFGAHALKKHVDANDLAVWNTAVKYQLVHVLALIGVDAVAYMTRDVPRAQGPLSAAGALFVVGVFIFSGSLYALVGTGVRKLGMVTPLGGLALLAGWVALGVGAWRARG